ncbi:hypothetical protein [Gimesia chilikensis]|uniref:hypothetical protein n=1 Tax=Gimesia chilikensis TaxID=2605989 RepID=UPI003A916145
MSKYLVLITLFYSFSCVTTLLAEDGESRPYDRAIDFIENKMIGKTLETKVVTKINKGNIETEFHRRVLYTNLVKTEDSASFDAIILIRQRLWDLNENGKRKSETPREKNRALVLRYGVHALKSTNGIIGNSIPLLNSMTSSFGEGSTIQLFVEKDKLKMITATPLYSEGFGKDDSWIPLASSVTTTFSSNEGKLSAIETEEGFNVDPDTLKRQPSGHCVTLHSKEIPGLY